MGGYDLYKKLNILEKRILELRSENKRMYKCLEYVKIWCDNFGVNAFGILVEDDIE